jgi:type VI secretion system protein ImpL
MRDLLVSVSRQLNLSTPPASRSGERNNPVQGERASRVTDQEARLQALFGLGPRSDAAVARPGREIDDRYRALRDVVDTDGGAQIDRVLKLVTNLQQQLAKLAASAGRSGSTPAPGDDPIVAMQAEAQRQPQPLARWLASTAGSGLALRGGGARQQVVATYNAANGPGALCAAIINGRYPFVPAATGDVSIQDFERLFAPGGLLDGFFNTFLKPYVDISGRVWKPQNADGIAAPVSQADVLQFQRAAQIRDMFFPDGRTSVAFRFDVMPGPRDPAVAQATLDFDGTLVSQVGGPPRATQITWPGPSRMLSVRLIVDPPPPGTSGILQDTAVWSMFRLFGRGKLQQAGHGNRYILTFQLGGRQVTFELGNGAALPLLATGALQEFRCPSVQ